MYYAHFLHLGIDDKQGQKAQGSATPLQTQRLVDSVHATVYT